MINRCSSLRSQSPKIYITGLIPDEPFLFKTTFQSESGFFQGTVGRCIVHMGIGLNTYNVHIMNCIITYSLHTFSIDSPVLVLTFQEIPDDEGCIFRLKIIELNLPDGFSVVFNDPCIITFLNL